MPEYLCAEDPIFLMLRDDFKCANELYQTLKTLPNLATDLLHFQLLLQSIHDGISDCIHQLPVWREGKDRSGELNYLKHEIKQLELAVFEGNRPAEFAIVTHGEKFISTTAKFNALFGIAREYRYSPI